ncbi:MAG: two-component system sensor histidine kinase NtrB [Betaproteobacteria bacterium]
MSQTAYAFLGLTAIVAALVGILTFAVLKFTMAARDVRRNARRGGDAAVLSAALQDVITGLKAQERATAARAEASERLSEEIIASLTAGLLVVDLGGDIRILNPAGRRLLGLPQTGTPDDSRRLRGLTLWPVIDQCLTTRVAIHRRTVALSGGTGGASHLGVTVSPLYDERGDLHGAISLFSDLTAVKELEEQLRLKASLATVGELTAGIAHEFRNGLATIHGYGKLLDPNALPPEYRRYVEGIRAETESLGEIVNNFLAFARPAQLTLTRVDLRAICERAADEIGVEARALGGDIAVRGSFATIDGDEVLLRQAFSNLLRNAVEACAGAGVAPTVIVQSEVDPALHVSRIAVDDNGPGVDPAARDRVFRPFFTSKRSGTGLGLALVQKIIVFHNGRIAVATSTLGGASFRVTLPGS